MVATSLAAAMEKGGVKTTAARLRLAAEGALAATHGNIERALQTFEKAVSKDGIMLTELHRFYLQIYQERFRAGLIKSDLHRADTSAEEGGGHCSREIQGGHVAPKNQSTRDISARLRVAEKIVASVFDRYRTADGKPWGDVGAHELNAMGADGRIAEAVREKLGILSKRDQFKPIRELLSEAQFESIQKRLHNANS